MAAQDYRQPEPRWREAQDLNLRTAFTINGLANRRHKPLGQPPLNTRRRPSTRRTRRSPLLATGTYAPRLSRPPRPASHWWTGLESNQPLRIFSPPLSPFELPVQSLRRVPFPRRTTFGWDNAPPIPLHIHHTDLLCNASCREIAFFGAVPAS